MLRLKNKAQTLSMDFGIPPTKFDIGLQKTTSEDSVSALFDLNLITSSLNFAVLPSPLSRSLDCNFQGNESWSPKPSIVGSELGLELENRVEETISPLVKERPQLSPMELFPHLFPKVCRSCCQGKLVAMLLRWHLCSTYAWMDKDDIVGHMYVFFCGSNTDRMLAICPTEICCIDPSLEQYLCICML
jgi:hypothetical protein